jgi:hypothetical protein
MKQANSAASQRVASVRVALVLAVAAMLVFVASIMAQYFTAAV